MPCIVPTCGASIGTFRNFPEHMTLAERWLAAISTGCGVKVIGHSSKELSLKQICQWHFAEPTGEAYQEPKIFFNCKDGRDVEIDSCRMCLRFFPNCEMVSMDGELSGMDIKTAFYESLGIDLKSDNFLKLICTECLARLELLKFMQEEFLTAEDRYRNLASIICENGADLPLAVEVIMHDDQEESNSEEANVADGSGSDDDWKPPKVPTKVDKKPKAVRVKSRRKPVPRNDTEQPAELSLKEIIARKCYICPVILESASELASHLIEKHSNMKANRCEECSRDFPILSGYNKHLARHDSTRRPHKCNFCSIAFKCKPSVKVHENTHHGTNHPITMPKEQKAPSTCETCGLSFEYKSKLKHHLRQKHSSRERPKCKVCHATFSTHSTLVRHMLLHADAKPYSCDKCDATFRRLLDFKRHTLKVHEGKNPFVCAECQQEFRSYELLYMHKRVVHQKRMRPVNISKPTKVVPVILPCGLCKETFLKGSELKQHIEMDHAGEDYPYKECRQCPKKFVTAQALSNHKATHTDRCVCKECGKRFQSTQAVKVHVESTHENRLFNCPECPDKTYKSYGSLRLHMAIHTKGKQFRCEFCAKLFLRNDQLTNHRRIHTGEKPYECPYCSNRFGDAGTFSKHKKRCRTVHEG